MVPIHLIEHVRCAWGPLLVPITSPWPPILLRRNPPSSNSSHAPSLHPFSATPVLYRLKRWHDMSTKSSPKSPTVLASPLKVGIIYCYHWYSTYISSKYFPSTKFSLLFKYHIFPLLQIISVSQEFFSLSKTAAVPEVKYCPFILKNTVSLF